MGGPASGSASRPETGQGSPIATIPIATPTRPSHWIALSRSPRKTTAKRIVTAGPNDDASPTIQVGALESPINPLDRYVGALPLVVGPWIAT